MDHGKSVRMITVLVLLCATQVTASFNECYGSCLEDCYAAAGERIACLIKCLFKCRKTSETLTNADSCKFNCAINQCSRFGDDVGKMDDCMNSCESGKCKDLSQAMETLPRQ